MKPRRFEVRFHLSIVNFIQRFDGFPLDNDFGIHK